MFLVRAENKKRPRVYRLDPFETTGNQTGYRGQQRRQPCAWQIKPAGGDGTSIGFAAVANTVDDGYSLIEKLRNRIASEEAAVNVETKTGT
jgi:hypothetical protein